MSSPRLESIRSKLWKGEAPGREDPYDPNSPMRETKEVSKEEALGEKEKQEWLEEEVYSVVEREFDPRLDVYEVMRDKNFDRYEAAKDWMGLEWVGGKEWLEVRSSDLGREYTGFLARQKAMEKGQIIEAIAEALAVAGLAGSGHSKRTVEWKTISLKDLGVKLQVVRHVMHKTGVVIPDPVIQGVETPDDLYYKLITPKKAKKVADVLMNDARFTRLRNVKVYPRRITPIDKEKEVGRWKMMEEELTKRGLPVTGSR